MPTRSWWSIRAMSRRSARRWSSITVRKTCSLPASSARPRMNLINGKGRQGRGRLRYRRSPRRAGCPGRIVDAAGGTTGAEVMLGLRPEHMVESSDQAIKLEGVVDVVERLGEASYLYMHLEDGTPANRPCWTAIAAPEAATASRLAPRLTLPTCSMPVARLSAPSATIPNTARSFPPLLHRLRAPHHRG